MSALARVTQKQFGVNGSVGNFGEFGSKAEADPTYSLDPAAIMSRGAFVDEGWADAVVDGNVPELEDMNGLFLVAFYQLTYLLEKGVPEWIGTTTYWLNSICQYNGEMYKSLQNTNLNKNPASEPTYWESVIGSRGVQTGVIQTYGGTVAPTGYLICDGAAVSRSTYAALFAVIGTAFGAGDTTTTFNLPDGRERTFVGYKSGSVEFGSIGATYGEKVHTLNISEIPAHTHNILGRNDQIDNGYPTLTGSTQEWTGATQSAGGGGSHNNIQPSLTANWIIKT